MSAEVTHRHPEAIVGAMAVAAAASHAAATHGKGCTPTELLHWNTSRTRSSIQRSATTTSGCETEDTDDIECDGPQHISHRGTSGIGGR
ncbi:hypothetical protein ACQPZ2_28545 [Nocardia pseudovaccinii]|uniref:hypothetical protein n=1 Tax=Nocardia pseudovaccinii TaxID=189540 RepID=UPI003D8A8EEE